VLDPLANARHPTDQRKNQTAERVDVFITIRFD
jgi:hypothetical protein